jgi:hypothetical protein
MMNTYFCQAGASAEFGILDGIGSRVLLVMQIIDMVYLSPAN